MTNGPSSTPSEETATVDKRQRFQVQDSCFTNALKSSAVVRSLYSLVHAALILLLLVTSFQYYFLPQTWDKDVDLLRRSFAQVHLVLGYEVLMNAALLLLVPSVRSPHRFLTYCGVFVIFLFIMVLPVVVRFYCDLHYVMAIVVIMEQTRFLMKAISFVYENLVQSRVPQPPTLRSLLYFLFAPTLIYQHSYPRCERRDWKSIAVWAYEVLVFLWCGLIVLSHGFIDTFEKVGTKELTAEDWFQMVTQSAFLGLVVSMSVAYAFLHSWLNMWAELLQFGDRTFYKDWTTSNNNVEMLPRFNFIVHLWIKEYLYKPVIRRTGSRVLASHVAFTISFLMHDYCICLPLKIYFFYYTAAVAMLSVCGTLAILFPRLSPFPAKLEQKPQIEPPPLNVTFAMSMIVANMLISGIYAIRFFETHNCPETPLTLLKSLTLVTVSDDCRLDPHLAHVNISIH